MLTSKAIQHSLHFKITPVDKGIKKVYILPALQKVKLRNIKNIDNNYINSVTLRTPCHTHLLDPNLENPRLVLQAAFSLSWVPGKVSFLVVVQV